MIMSQNYKDACAGLSSLWMPRSRSTGGVIVVVHLGPCHTQSSSAGAASCRRSSWHHRYGPPCSCVIVVHSLGHWGHWVTGSLGQLPPAGAALFKSVLG